MRARVAQLVVHPTSKQEVRGSIPEPGRSHHKEVSDLQGRGSMYAAGQITRGFLGDFERFVCTDSGRLLKPVRGREYKL